MNSWTPRRILVVASAIVAFAPLARAGVGQVVPAGLSSGLTHPFREFDYVLLLMCAGIWTAQLGRRARFTIPGLLVSVMACGAALGLSGPAPAMLQTIGLLAILGCALLVLGPVRWSFALIAAPLAVIVFFQGIALAPQLGARGNGLGFTAGLMAGSMLLYVLGLVVGTVIADWIHRHRDHWTDHAGGRLAH